MTKRKLKYPTKRKPTEMMNMKKLIEDVAFESGFHKKDVEEVLKLAVVKMREALLDKKQVYLEGIGGIFAFLYRGRKLNNLRGGEGDVINLPAKYRARYQPSVCLKADLERMHVSQSDLDDLYEE